jgi:hypothetical protein
MDLLIAAICVLALIAIGRRLPPWPNSTVNQPEKQPEISVEAQEQMRAKVWDGFLILGSSIYKISEIESIEKWEEFGVATRLRFTSGHSIFLFHEYNHTFKNDYFIPEDEIMQLIMKNQ